MFRVRKYPAVFGSPLCVPGPIAVSRPLSAHLILNDKIIILKFDMHNIINPCWNE